MSLSLNSLWYFMAGVILLFLPGVAWQYLFKSSKRDFFELLAQAAGLSISLFSLGALYAYLLGLKFSLSGIIIFLAVCLIIVGIQCWRFISRRSTASHVALDLRNASLRMFIGVFTKTNLLILMGLGMIFLLILGWRLMQLRGVLLPSWVDSVHHVLIIRLILESRSLPATLEPYLPVPFYYHYAYHYVTAIYSFLTHLSPEQATLIFGQILNAAIALSVYRLGKVLWQDWRRAGLAAVLVGFVSQMPAYYLTWGRYPLLTGMLILPLTMAEALEIVRKDSRLSRILTLALLTSGLLLTHYYTALLFAVFLVILMASQLIQYFRDRKATILIQLAPIVAAGGLGLVLALPWLGRMWQFSQTFTAIGSLLPDVEAVEQAYFPNYIPYLWKLLGPTHNHLLLFLAFPGMILAIWKKSTRIFGIWTLTLALLSLPWMIQIAPFRPDHAAIVLFLPVCLLVSDLFISSADWVGHGRFATYNVIAVMLPLLALFAWGMWQSRSVINASTILVDQADVNALQWISLNTPPESNFLINVSPWQAGIFRGVDGGWWIMPITGRSTFLPPALYTLGPKKYVDQINQWAGSVSQLTGCTSEFDHILDATKVTHIYIHDGKGQLSSQSLQKCPGLIELYDQQGVHIYQTLPSS